MCTLIAVGIENDLSILQLPKKKDSGCELVPRSTMRRDGRTQSIKARGASSSRAVWRSLQDRTCSRVQDL